MLKEFITSFMIIGLTSSIAFAGDEPVAPVAVKPAFNWIEPIKDPVSIGVPASPQYNTILDDPTLAGDIAFSARFMARRPSSVILGSSVFHNHN